MTGSNNIDIGNAGGSTSENGTIRIGTAGTQTRTYIAGIIDSHLRGWHVVISDDGQLGVEGSSERYKTDIAPMSSNTDKLDKLRPVTFRLKTDPHGPIQYGLIAEEVAKVYPELVIRDRDGKIDGVRYEELAPVLLNEVQKQQTTIATLVEQRDADTMKLNAQATEIEEQSIRIGSLEQQVAKVNDLEQRLNAVLQQLKANDHFVAQR